MKYKIFKYSILVNFLLINFAYSQLINRNSFSSEQSKSSLFHFNSLKDKVDYFKELFKVDCLEDKITDNFGNGYDSLYGTRNMKTILYGIVYRGGANNFYNKHSKRDNHNPLPVEGLQNLCNVGFSDAIYLYSTNFNKTAQIFFNSDSSNKLIYIQNMLSDNNKIREIFEMIKQRLEEPNLGPIYLHCWNGWHQSGFISAAILMQFCSYSNQKALDYWIRNTDGVNKGFENVKNRILNFKTFKDITLDKETQDLICPCEKNEH